MPGPAGIEVRGGGGLPRSPDLPEDAARDRKQPRLGRLRAAAIAGSPVGNRWRSANTSRPEARGRSCGRPLWRRAPHARRSQARYSRASWSSRTTCEEHSRFNPGRGPWTPAVAATTDSASPAVWRDCRKRFAGAAPKETASCSQLKRPPMRCMPRGHANAHLWGDGRFPTRRLLTKAISPIPPIEGMTGRGQERAWCLAGYGVQ